MYALIHFVDITILFLKKLFARAYNQLLKTAKLLQSFCNFALDFMQIRYVSRKLIDIRELETKREIILTQCNICHLRLQ